MIANRAGEEEEREEEREKRREERQIKIVREIIGQ